MTRMTTWRRSAMMIALVLGTAALTACQQDKVKAPGPGRADPLATTNYPTVAALEGLSEYLAFTEPKVQRGANTPMQVTVPVRSLYDKRGMNVQYRFEFFDDQGVPLEPQMQWRFLHLPPRAQHFMEGAALDREATDWRLLVRPAR